MSENTLYSTIGLSMVSIIMGISLSVSTELHYYSSLQSKRKQLQKNWTKDTTEHNYFLCLEWKAQLTAPIFPEGHSRGGGAFYRRGFFWPLKGMIIYAP
jgi:hypothetical protein